MRDKAASLYVEMRPESRKTATSLTLGDVMGLVTFDYF